tara:strand:- start:272 stop:604 length:333 start_codon:yes stop_codon:yes gene_type:complete
MDNNSTYLAIVILNIFDIAIHVINDQIETLRILGNIACIIPMLILSREDKKSKTKIWINGSLILYFMFNGLFVAIPGNEGLGERPLMSIFLSMTIILHYVALFNLRNKSI